MKVTRWAPVTGAAAALAATAPMLAWAVSITSRRPLLYLDGDPALDELSLINSGHFAQLVGNYSRFGWWHPGPAWFYAMDVVYQPLGRESWAFSVAIAMFQAVAVALILYACWRIAGLPLVAGGSALLLGYYALIGDHLFLSIWPPYVVILPMLLLLLLAGLAAAGSTPALAGALLVGSFEIQTHVGTAPTVIAVLAGAFVLRAGLNMLARRADGWGPRAEGRWKWPLTLAGLGLVVVMWIPPLVDEVTGNPGNLTLLYRFFRANGASRGFRAGLSAIGRFVDPVEFPKLTAFRSSDVATISTVHILIAVVFAALCAALAYAGWRTRDRFALGLGSILLLTIVAITLSVRDVVGPVYYYLLLWVTILPVALLLGAVVVALRHFPRLTARMPRVARRSGVLLGAALLAVVAVVQVWAFLAVPPEPPYTHGVAELSTAAVTALAADPTQPVLLKPNSLDVWPATAGVGLQLVKQGHPIRVDSPWVVMFGNQSRLQGDEHVELDVVAAGDTSDYLLAHPDATMVTSTADYALFLLEI